MRRRRGRAQGPATQHASTFVQPCVVHTFPVHESTVSQNVGDPPQSSLYGPDMQIWTWLSAHRHAPHVHSSAQLVSQPADTNAQTPSTPAANARAARVTPVVAVPLVVHRPRRSRVSGRSSVTHLA